MHAVKDRDRARDVAGDRHEWAGDRSLPGGKLSNVIAVLTRVGQQGLGVIRETPREVGRPAHHAQSGQVFRSHFDLHTQRRASSVDGRDDRGALQLSV